jgi:lipid-A-disaccharide synthase
VVLVDFGAFNARVGRFAKGLGIPVFYYFPPSSWRRQGGDPGRLRSVADRVAAPFPWSAERLRDAGIDAHWVGHPVVDQAALRDGSDNATTHGSAATLVYLPGSRMHEIRHIGPVMVESARLLSQRDPSLLHIVVRSGGVSAESFDSVFGSPDVEQGRAPRFKVVPETQVHEVLEAASVVITKAGTVTLEVAVHRKPMVVLYRVGLLQELEYHLLHRRRIRFIAMPNILAGRGVCPELLQRDASAARIAALAWELLTEPAARARQVEGLGEVATMLGPPGAAARAARLALSMIDDNIEHSADGSESGADRREHEALLP